jgi:hypothetical protein
VGQTYSPQGSPNRNAPLALANGQHLKEMVFKLTPQGVISGRILDEDGDPLANVEVQCLVYSYQRGKRALVNHAGSSTNDLGEFRLFGLGPGKYVISATDQSRDIFDPERTVGTAQTILDAEARGATIYYPTGTNPEGASSLEITPGAQISGINMTLTRVHAVSVKGHVSIKSAAAQRNMNIMLTARGVNGFRTFVRGIDVQGNFELRGVAPGSYFLHANYSEDNKQYSARLPLEVGNSNIEGVELELHPAAEVEGRLEIEKNGDLKNLRMNVLLQSQLTDRGGSGTVVKDDKTFKLENIIPDLYDINVFPLPEGFYLKSIRLGKQDVTETGADLSQGVSGGQMIITLNPNGGQIDGTVQNAKGDPAAGATVTLIPNAEHQSISWLYQTANTDQNGHFTIKGARPGEYKIYAWEDIEQGAQQDPDFVKPHESLGETVSVKESGHETVQLKLISSENTPNQQVSR